jgi:protein-L-isoaspartate(D-aspartate) O-methyltransferase
MPLMVIDQGMLRRQMVEQQLGRRGIRDPVIVRAMATVPREAFVPRALAEFAYDDSALPIEADQTISQPYVVALMAEALELEPDDRVLEIGTGSGYAAAVLAEIAAEVYTIERHCALADAAGDRLAALGVSNVFVRCGDGTLGWPEEAPFDAIVVAAGGPAVPDSLRAQLAIGGRLVMPVGGADRVQRLLLVRRVGDSKYRETDLGPVRFVPLIGAEGWPEASSAPSSSPPQAKPQRRTAATAAEIVAHSAEPFAGIDSEHEALLGRIGDSRVVLLGEATHGTAEFYDMRARITRALIEEGHVRFVAVEADWPDARQIDRFVRGEGAGAHPERAFTRFPTWMWANRSVAVFCRWLRDWNAAQPPSRKTGFYGLDLYSMYTSIRAVLAYLEDVDPGAARVARARYECLAPWQADPSAYAAAASNGEFERCEREVVRTLADLLENRMEYSEADGDRFFDAKRNAALVKNAQSYYRAMYRGSQSAWNLRDGHMFDTLLDLLAPAAPEERAVVWAHNSHLGNAAATALGARGETNLGELCRAQFGERCYSIGFGTDRGTVAAADRWDGPMCIKDVRPAHESSYERICRDSRIARFKLPLRAAHRAAARAALLDERLERAIGVIYRPDTELQSHYFHAALPRQFDEWIWFEETRAVEALPVAPDEDKGPDTFPFGV